MSSGFKINVRLKGCNTKTAEVTEDGRSVKETKSEREKVEFVCDRNRKSPNKRWAM